MGWVPDIIGNAVRQAGEMTVGFIPGMYQLGRSAVHDAGKAVGLASGQYQLDDIARSMGREYKRYYSPLFRGDLGQFWENVEDQPLSLALDAATLVSGGGAAVARLGKAGHLGESGYRLAGMQARPGMAWQDAVKAGGRYNSALGMAYTPVGLKQSVRGALGETSGISRTKALSSNPVTRTRQLGVQKALDVLPEDMKVLGRNRRIGKTWERDIEKARIAHSYEVTKRLIDEGEALTPVERRAARVAMTGMNPDTLAEGWRKQLNALEDTSHSLDDLMHDRQLLREKANLDPDDVYAADLLEDMEQVIALKKMGEGDSAPFVRARIEQRIRGLEEVRDSGLLDDIEGNPALAGFLRTSREVFDTELAPRYNRFMGEKAHARAATREARTMAANPAAGGVSDEMRRAVRAQLDEGESELAAFDGTELASADAGQLAAEILDRQALAVEAAEKAALAGTRSKIYKDLNPTTGMGRSGPTLGTSTSDFREAQRELASHWSAGKGHGKPNEGAKAAAARETAARVEEFIRAYATGGAYRGGKQDVTIVRGIDYGDIHPMFNQEFAPDAKLAEAYRQEQMAKGAYQVVRRGDGFDPDEVVAFVEENYPKLSKVKAREYVEKLDEYERLVADPELVMAKAREVLGERRGVQRGEIEGRVGAARKQLEQFDADTPYDPRLEPYRMPVTHSLLADGDLMPSGKASAVPTSKAQRQGTMRKSKGVAFAGAMDDFDNPHRSLAFAFETLANYDRHMSRWEKLLDDAPLLHGMDVDDIDVGRPSDRGTKWVALDKEGGRDFIQKWNQWKREITSLSDELGVEDPLIDDLTQHMDAMLDKRGGVPIIPRAMYDAATKEFRGVSDLMKAYDQATGVWRFAVLSARPAWMVNNLAGNLVLASVGYGPRRAVRGFLRGRSDEWKNLADQPEVGAGFSATQVKNVGKDLGEGKIRGGARRVADVIADFNSKTFDTPPRRAAFLAELEPLVDEYVKTAARQGLDVTPVEAAKILMRDGQVRTRVADGMLDKMVDFTNLSGFEKNVLRRMFPFYSWMKGITVVGGKMTLDTPYKANAVANLSQHAIRENEKLAGRELPSFMKGAIYFGKPDENGRARSLSTYGLNPYATISDVAGMANATLFGGSGAFSVENPAASLNPLLRLPIEAVANRNLFYGGPLDYTGTRGYAERMVRSFPQNIPAVSVGKKLLWDAPRMTAEERERKLYAPDASDYLGGYFLGLPLRTANMDVAGSLAKTENVRGVAIRG